MGSKCFPCVLSLPRVHNKPRHLGTSHAQATPHATTERSSTGSATNPATMHLWRTATTCEPAHTWTCKRIPCASAPLKKRPQQWHSSITSCSPHFCPEPSFPPSKSIPPIFPVAYYYNNTHPWIGKCSAFEQHPLLGNAHLCLLPLSASFCLFPKVASGQSQRGQQ